MQKSATLSILAFLVFVAGCTTERMGKVTVVNETGEPIDSLTVMHKYSNLYRDTHTWTNIASGVTTASMNVSYNTGPFTTGKDWWIVSWVNANGTNVTSPNNFRQYIDPFEKALANADTNQLDNYLKSIQVTVPSEVVGSIVYKVLASMLFNTEPTVGYKQHILRADDADTNCVTKILIYPANTPFPGTNNTNAWTQGWFNRFWYGLPVANAVVFESHSGNSVTVYTNLVDVAASKTGTGKK